MSQCQSHFLYDMQDSDSLVDDKSDRRLYIGNLDHRITEAVLIKMFSPFGKIVSEDFLWHTRGPKRGEPRGFAFIQFNTKEEAKLAKEKMHGKLACGRPLVVRFASEKYLPESEANPSKTVSDGNKSSFVGNSSGQMSRSAKIAAIKNKLKALEDDGSSLKKPRQGDRIT
ncbi:Rna-binding protein-like rna recognition motif protein [Thalictrum thalictroides]|uniref:Probable RNA-binding protein 18 n=1 Tax=Thalictrum thalictroides TaxID=46969 RepID=A0A7J6UTI6_THATH|nr:Rna-binding protein-like rna recognition motif protein [Thalictrum thalictroides]